MAQWEYRIASSYLKDMTPAGTYRIPEFIWRLRVSGEDYTLEEGLDMLGQQGWELVTVQQERQRAESGGELTFLYIFKRSRLSL